MSGEHEKKKMNSAGGHSLIPSVMAVMDWLL